MTSLHDRVFKCDRLKLIARADEFQDSREPPLCLGDVVQLNSGGPNCLVVDLEDGNTGTISWRDSSGTPQELPIPLACVHRIDVVD